jgi:hypothetical protein
VLPALPAKYFPLFPRFKTTIPHNKKAVSKTTPLADEFIFKVIH